MEEDERTYENENIISVMGTLAFAISTLKFVTEEGNVSQVPSATSPNHQKKNS